MYDEQVGGDNPFDSAKRNSEEFLDQRHCDVDDACIQRGHEGPERQGKSMSFVLLRGMMNTPF